MLAGHECRTLARCSVRSTTGPEGIAPSVTSGADERADRDQEMIGRITRRDDEALAELYDRYAAALFAFAVRRLGDRGEAELVVQDVFTRVWRHAGTYVADRGTVRTWLYGLARHAVIDQHRRRARRRRPLAVTDIPARADEIDALLDATAVQTALARLSPIHRRVLELAYFEGRTLADIARLLDVPVGTVKSRIYYALRGLRLACEELGIDQ